MNKKELFKKNHLLGYEFDRYILEHPVILAQIPDSAEIIFLPQEDPNLCRENRKLAEKLKARGGKVVFVHIGKMTPPRSRLKNIRLEFATR